MGMHELLGTYKQVIPVPLACQMLLVICWTKSPAIPKKPDSSTTAASCRPCGTHGVFRCTLALLALFVRGASNRGWSGCFVLVAVHNGNPSTVIDLRRKSKIASKGFHVVGTFEDCWRYQSPAAPYHDHTLKKVGKMALECWLSEDSEDL